MITSSTEEVSDNRRLVASDVADATFSSRGGTAGATGMVVAVVAVAVVVAGVGGWVEGVIVEFEVEVVEVEGAADEDPATADSDPDFSRLAARLTGSDVSFSWSDSGTGEVGV